MSYKKWTDEEIQFLKDNYNIISKDDLISQFPNRSYDSIQLKANKLGLYKIGFIKKDNSKQWTQQEIQFLKNNSNKNINELCELFENRSKSAILNQLTKHKIKYAKIIRNKTKQNDYKINNSMRSNYLKNGIILDINKGCDTYTIIDWYYFILENKVTEIPKQVINKESTILLFRYVIENILNFRTREDILNIKVDDLRFNKLYFRKFKLPTELYKVINIIYPEYKIEPWELKMTGIKIFKDESNIIDAITWFLEKTNLNIEKIKNINKYIDCSVEHLFSKYGLSCLITKSYFNGYQNLFVWYFNKTGGNLSIHDFRYKTNNYWANKDNANYQMKKFIDYLFNNNLINNLKYDLPQYFSKNFLETTDYIMLSVCINKYKHYKNYYEWIIQLYPDFNLNKEDFSIYIGLDGKNKCDSLEEKKLFDYIYSNLNIIDIKSIGIYKKYKFYNDKYNEYYIPDFIIKKYSDLIFDKPIFIEYYGLYVPGNKCNMIIKYIEKTKRKNEFYKSQEDIYFIDIYPDDLKNNFRGVKNKLTSFFMYNFNMNISNIKNIEEGGEMFESTS